MLGAIKNALPWQAKILAKIVLSRLPISYRLWSKVGLFRHGDMDDFSYAWDVLQLHTAVLPGAKDWRGLELGPGNGLLSSLLAPAALSSGLVLLDAGDFAHKNISHYHAQVKKFIAAFPGVELPDYSGASDAEAMLIDAGGRYLCNGLESMRQLEAGAFDLIFSHAVLEHIRRVEFVEIMQECFRLVKPNGVVSHVIDFRDHLGGGLNNLRIPTQTWERPWFAAKSGFYTNRLRLSEIVSICERVGFRVELMSTTRWAKPPIDRSRLAQEFRHLPNEDLTVLGAHITMKRK